jgi:hypothetical protein
VPPRLSSRVFATFAPGFPGVLASTLWEPSRHAEHVNEFETKGSKYLTNLG